MNIVANGTINGLTWYELPAGAAGGAPIIVVTREEKIPTRAEARKIVSANSWRYGMHAVELRWFRPFDAAVAFPGKTVRYRDGRFKDADATRWMHEHLDVPADLDVRLKHDGDDLLIVARTMRKGLEAVVVRQLRTDITLGEALAVEIPYLMRHCRRPTEEPGLRCRSYLNAMMSGMTDHALRILTSWLARLSDPKQDEKQDLWLPGGLLRAKGVEAITLSYDKTSKSLRCATTLTGGQSLEEDDTGLELVLSGSLPTSVRLAAVGRPLSDVIGVSWADTLRIKTVRNGGPDDPTSMRIHCEGEPFAQPAGSPLDHEEADRVLAHLGDPDVDVGGRAKRLSLAVLQALEGMDARDMATTLALLCSTRPLDLEPYGRPGWTIRNNGGTIVAEKCPTLGYGKALATLTPGRTA